MGAVILPGSYDPVTLGHVDMIRRAAEIYSEVYAVIFIISSIFVLKAVPLTMS